MVEVRSSETSVGDDCMSANPSGASRRKRKDCFERQGLLTALHSFSRERVCQNSRQYGTEARKARPKTGASPNQTERADICAADARALARRFPFSFGRRLLARRVG